MGIIVHQKVLGFRVTLFSVISLDRHLVFQNKKVGYCNSSEHFGTFRIIVG